MEILDSQDRIIRQIFPVYDRTKSSVVFEFGNECFCNFIVRIYQKGSHRFDVEGGKIMLHKRIE